MSRGGRIIEPCEVCGGNHVSGSKTQRECQDRGRVSARTGAGRGGGIAAVPPPSVGPVGMEPWRGASAQELRQAAEDGNPLIEDVDSAEEFRELDASERAAYMHTWWKPGSDEPQDSGDIGGDGSSDAKGLYYTHRSTGSELNIEAWVVDRARRDNLEVCDEDGNMPEDDQDMDDERYGYVINESGDKDHRYYGEARTEFRVFDGATEDEKLDGTADPISEDYEYDDSSDAFVFARTSLEAAKQDRDTYLRREMQGLGDFYSFSGHQ